MKRNKPNIFERIAKLQKRITTPKLLAEELNKRDCFVDVPENAQEKYALQIENIPDDNKNRYISYSVYSDNCLLATVLFLEGKKIVKIAKVKVG